MTMQLMLSFWCSLTLQKYYKKLKTPSIHAGTAQPL